MSADLAMLITGTAVTLAAGMALLRPRLPAALGFLWFAVAMPAGLLAPVLALLTASVIALALATGSPHSSLGVGGLTVSAVAVLAALSVARRDRQSTIVEETTGPRAGWSRSRPAGGTPTTGSSRSATSHTAPTGVIASTSTGPESQHPARDRCCYSSTAARGSPATRPSRPAR